METCGGYFFCTVLLALELSATLRRVFTNKPQEF